MKYIMKAGTLYFNNIVSARIKIASIMTCKGDKKKSPLLFGKSTGYPWRAGEKKFS